MSNQRVHCLLDRSNISPGCCPCPSSYPSLIQVSVGKEGKVAKDGHEQVPKMEWEYLRICQGLKDGRLNFTAGSPVLRAMPMPRMLGNKSFRGFAANIHSPLL